MELPNAIGIIAILVSLFAIAVSIIMGVLTLYVSNRKSESIAKEYGDVAGNKAAIAHAEKKSAEARITVLKALRNEVSRIRKLVEINSQINDDGVGMVRMPTAALETAFISEPSGLLVNPDLLDTVANYLAFADSTNSQFDTYLGFASAAANITAGHMQHAVAQVRGGAQAIPEVLNKLDRLLEREFGDEK